MPKRLTDEERAFREVPEKQLQDEFMADARKLGWTCFHVSDSRKLVRRGNRYIPVPDPDIKGYPDITMFHFRWGVVFVEVKKELGTLEPEQEVARNAILQAGCKWYLLKPSTRDKLTEGLVSGF